jgi:hypothetical protein
MADLTPEEELAEEREVLARLGDEIVRRRMAMPAIFVLESIKPLNFLASQGLIFFEPIVRSILSIKHYDIFTRALERRENVEWLIRRLEEADEKRREDEKQPCDSPPPPSSAS